MKILITIGVGFASGIGVILVVFLVIRSLPSDYFVRKASDGPPLTLLEIARKVFRNVLGLALIIAGIILFTPIFLLPPGSGLVIAAVGLILTDLPGKRWLLQKVIRSPKAVKALNWIRGRVGKEPFLLVPVEKMLETQQSPQEITTTEIVDKVS